MHSLKSDNRGFTIIELMIATSVFSAVLLVCTFGLLEVGRTYYKGVTTSRTQEAARRALVDVTEAIKFNGGSIVLNDSVYCIGSKRYSFVINNKIEDDGGHALVSDNVTNCDPNTSSQDLNAATLSSTSEELLGARMRLAKFEIEPVTVSGAADLYRVTVRVASGEDDMFTDNDGTKECKIDRSSSQFCAVSELTTTVQRRINNE